MYYHRQQQPLNIRISNPKHHVRPNPFSIHPHIKKPSPFYSIPITKANPLSTHILPLPLQFYTTHHPPPPPPTPTTQSDT